MFSGKSLLFSVVGVIVAMYIQDKFLNGATTVSHASNTVRLVSSPANSAGAYQV